jgi:hypothetical protein
MHALARATKSCRLMASRDLCAVSAIERISTSMLMASISPFGPNSDIRLSRGYALATSGPKSGAC